MNSKARIFFPAMLMGLIKIQMQVLFSVCGACTQKGQFSTCILWRSWEGRRWLQACEPHLMTVYVGTLWLHAKWWMNYVCVTKLIEGFWSQPDSCLLAKHSLSSKRLLREKPVGLQKIHDQGIMCLSKHTGFVPVLAAFFCHTSTVAMCKLAN